MHRFWKEAQVPRYDVLVVLGLLVNALGWYYMILTFLDRVVTQLNASSGQILTVWVTFHSLIVGSGIVGAFLSQRISRVRMLHSWVLLGMIASFLLVFINSFVFSHLLMVAAFLGCSLGIGLPSCLAHFADITTLENRGRIGGIILFIANVVAPFLVLPLGAVRAEFSAIIILGWRTVGLFTILLKPRQVTVTQRQTPISFLSILCDRSFALYFIGWLMFCFIDRFEQPILSHIFGEQYSFVFLLGPLLGSLSALVGGMFADWIGRKRIVIYSFASLGIAYAMVGIFTAPLISWYFSIIVLSISTGLLWILFIFVLWGDLSQSGSREKYYAIGGTPFFFTNIVQSISSEYAVGIPETSAFSVAAFFLFLAVLPLLYAPETLPQRRIELRQLKKYVESAKKIQQKYSRK